jgi:hypothetical protein
MAPVKGRCGTCRYLGMAPQSSDPSTSPDALPDRLAAHLRAIPNAGSASLQHLLDEEGLFDSPAEAPSGAQAQQHAPQTPHVAQAQAPAELLVQAERTALLASGPTVGQSDGHFPNVPAENRVVRSPAAMIKSLSTSTAEQPSARLHEATNLPPALPAAVPVDPSHMPPPVRKGIAIAAPARTSTGSTTTQPSKRDLKRQAKVAQQQAEAAAERARNTPPAQILDQRTPGKYREDSAFLVPLVPAMVVAAGGTYLWFQGAIRLMSLLPLVPILFGVMIGGIMRMGSRTVDFARITFAVMLTGFATFWGYAAIVSSGPLNELSKVNARWSDLPRVADTTRIISVFRDLAEQSLGTAAIMFAGLVAAGMISSVRTK